MSVWIRGRSTLDLRLCSSGCASASRWILMLADLCDKSEPPEDDSSSVSDGTTRTNRRSALYSWTGIKTGFCSVVPLYLGSSSSYLCAEPFNSLATEASSSSTLGAGGGRRQCEKSGSDLGILGSSGSKSSSLLARTWLSLRKRNGGLLTSPRVKAPTKNTYGLGSLAFCVVQVPVLSRFWISEASTMMKGAGSVLGW